MTGLGWWQSPASFHSLWLYTAVDFGLGLSCYLAAFTSPRRPAASFLPLGFCWQSWPVTRCWAGAGYMLHSVSTRGASPPSCGAACSKQQTPGSRGRGQSHSTLTWPQGDSFLLALWEPCSNPIRGIQTPGSSGAIKI